MTGCSLTGVGRGARLGADSGSSGWLSRIAPLEGRSGWLWSSRFAVQARLRREWGGCAGAALDHYDGGRTHGWHWKRNS